jgi:hypothetical protein
VFPFVHERHSWLFKDPARIEGSEEVRLEAFHRVRDAIDERIRLWMRDERHLPIQVIFVPESRRRGHLRSGKRSDIRSNLCAARTV